MRVTEFYQLDQNEQHTLSLRTRCGMANLSTTITEGFGKLGAVLAQNGLTLSDIPFIAYHNMDMEDIDLEVAFPVRAAVKVESPFVSGLVPADLYVQCVCLGPYDQLAPVYDEMMRWIDDNGYALNGAIYESYYNGPNCPAEHLLTRISAPIRKK